MFNWNDCGVIEKMVQVLEHDEIMLAESDTVLGLFGRLSRNSKEKIDVIKKRNLKPYIVMLGNAHELVDFVDQDISEQMRKIMQQYWPGPLTIIFKAKPNLPDWLKSCTGTIAIRVPAHVGLQKLLHKVNGIFTTSANISDQPLPHSYDQVNSSILQQVSLVCCQPGVLYDGPASTILDFSSGSIQVIRMGDILVDSI